MLLYVKQIKQLLLLLLFIYLFDYFLQIHTPYKYTRFTNRLFCVFENSKNNHMPICVTSDIGQFITF